MTFPIFPNECFVLLIRPSFPHSKLQSYAEIGTWDCWAGQRSSTTKEKKKEEEGEEER